MPIYDGEILIKKQGTFSGRESYAKGKFSVENDTYFIEITERINKQFSFEDFKYEEGFYEKTNFIGFIEFIEQNDYHFFELTLLPKKDMNKFEVIDDDEFKAMKIFFSALNLEKDLKTNEPTKNTKKKI